MTLYSLICRAKKETEQRSPCPTRQEKKRGREGRAESLISFLCGEPFSNGPSIVCRRGRCDISSRRKSVPGGFSRKKRKERRGYPYFYWGGKFTGRKAIRRGGEKGEDRILPESYGLISTMTEPGEGGGEKGLF